MHANKRKKLKNSDNLSWKNRNRNRKRNNARKLKMIRRDRKQ
jgi:hypothetical protein